MFSSAEVRPTRRGFLGALAAGAMGCRARAEDPAVLRLGFFASVSHAPALTLLASGRIASALQGASLRPSLFNAGPEAMTALASRSIDVCVVGPLPAAALFLRSRGRALRILSGVCSGGAALVVRRGAGIRGAADLRGRRLATPQLGNSQDLALRRYLRANGLADQSVGGEVTLTHTSNPNIAALLRRGHLDGAWVPEPWVSRLEDAGGEVLIDERALWPGGRFASAVLVAHPRYAEVAGPLLERVGAAMRAEVTELSADPARAAARTAEALRALTRVALPPALVARAMRRVDFASDPFAASIATMVRDAQGFGMLPSGSVAAMFAPSARRRVA